MTVHGHPKLTTTSDTYRLSAAVVSKITLMDIPQALDATPDPPLPAVTLDGRIPGQSVMAKLLNDPDHARPATRMSRIFGAHPLSADSRPWYQGALGEIEVGKILARLDSSWTVLHAVPVGAGESDIDHVAIGAAGVFTINTKHHAGQKVWVGERVLMVSGHKTDHIRNSVHEASRAAKLLIAAVGFDVPAEGVIAVVGAKELKIKKTPAGTTVLPATGLRRWLQKRRLVLTEDQLARVVAVARRPETWHRAPALADSPTDIRDGFTRIHQLVIAARRRRRVWGYGGMMAMALAAMALIFFAPVLVTSVVS